MQWWGPNHNRIRRSAVYWLWLIWFKFSKPEAHTEIHPSWLLFNLLKPLTSPWRRFYSPPSSLCIYKSTELGHKQKDSHKEVNTNFPEWEETARTSNPPSSWLRWNPSLLMRSGSSDKIYKWNITGVAVCQPFQHKPNDQLIQLFTCSSFPGKKRVRCCLWADLAVCFQPFWLF